MDSKAQVTKTNKRNIILKNILQKEKGKKKGMCKTRKQRRDISMFLKKSSRQRKTQQESQREKQKMKVARKNTKDTKKRKIYLKQSSFFFEKKFAKSEKKQKHIHTERENNEKKRNMENIRK